MAFRIGILLAALQQIVIAQGQTLPRDSPSIGEQICTFGYIMDEFCIVSCCEIGWPLTFRI